MRRTAQQLKLLIVLTFLIIGASCTNSIPIIDDSKPFVVGSIENFDDELSLSIYRSSNQSACKDGNEVGVNRPAVIMRTGLYNIGDTLQIYTKFDVYHDQNAIIKTISDCNTLQQEHLKLQRAYKELLETCLDK